MKYTIYTKSNYNGIYLRQQLVDMSLPSSPALPRVFMLNLTHRYEIKFALCKQINSKSADVTLMMQSLLKRFG